jgi:acyl CoA:acetate/3-ketoacid CoA transferase alpha subunit
MTIGIGGWGPRRKPMALVREILRSDLKDLTVVAYGGAEVGMLCAAGKVKKLVFGFVSLDFIPLEPFFRKARQAGGIEVHGIDEGLLCSACRPRHARALPADARRPRHRRARHQPGPAHGDSPYDDGETLVAMPALPLDAALLHVDRADARGVCQVKGRTSTWTTSSPARRPDLRELRRTRRPRSTSRRARRRATCSGSVRRPPAWCTCPAARTRAPAIRCTASTRSTSRSTGASAKEEGGWAKYHEPLHRLRRAGHYLQRSAARTDPQAAAAGVLIRSCDMSDIALVDRIICAAARPGRTTAKCSPPASASCRGWRHQPVHARRSTATC